MVMRRAAVVVLLDDGVRSADRYAQQEISEVGTRKRTVEIGVTVIIGADEAERRDRANPAHVESVLHRVTAFDPRQVVVELVGARLRNAVAAAAVQVRDVAGERNVRQPVERKIWADALERQLVCEIAPVKRERRPTVVERQTE